MEHETNPYRDPQAAGPPPDRRPSDVGPPRNSGLAVTALILGISSCLCLVTSFGAVVCGHLALGDIRRSQGRVGGRGMAIAGLVLGYLFVMVTILVFLLPIVVLPLILTSFSEPMCSHNMEMLMEACQEYVEDHDGEYPPTLEDLFAHGVMREELVCPRVLFQEAMNGNANPDPTYEIVFTGSEPAAGTVIIRENEPRHDGKRVVGYADGTVGLED